MFSCLRGYLFLLVFFLSGCLGMGTQPPAPAHEYGLRGGAGSAGVHTVEGTDTLYSIAERYKISMPDIISANNLQPPFALTSGQRLSLPPPQIYRVRAGDTLHDVSRLFNVSQTDIARQNNLSAPYALQTGRTLRLPSAARPVEIAERGPVFESAPVVEHVPVSIARRVDAVEKEELAAPAPAPARVAVSAPVSIQPIQKVAMITSPRADAAPGKFIWPVGGKVISSYGAKTGGLHNDGVNIKAPKNAPVRAAAGGTVVYAGSQLKGFGNLVLVSHADRWLTAYAHLDRLHVKKGDTIRQGQTVGTVGTTGSVTEPQLHFEIRRGKDVLNPEAYLAKQGV